jgi:LysR family glycine cleavage system transcriptional activator
MSRNLPPLTWFRAFDSAARTLSFTLAAEELGLTQSAISQHIRSLETRLGTPLFLRRPRGLALTDAGRRLVPDVAAAMARLRDATDAFAADQTGSGLTVATSVSVAQWYIAPNLPDLQRRLPDLRLRLVTGVWPDDFAAAEADVEIRFGSADVAGRGTAVALGSFDLVAIAAPGLHGLTAEASPQNIASLPLIQPVGITETWSKLLRLKGVKTEVDPAIFTDTHGLAVDLALSGAGVALTNRMIAAPALSQGRLIEINLGRVKGTEGYFLEMNGAAPMAEAAAFADWLTALVAKAAAV